MISRSPFGTTTDGQLVEQFSLTNQNNVKVDILSLGGIIRCWHIPQLAGKYLDIVLGYDSLDQYLADDSYLGALVGRYANRINKGKFSLAGVDYQADINLAGNCLHGGARGFSHQVWQCSILSSADNPSIMLELTSPDGDQGFPGNIQVKVIYTLTELNRLKIEYFADTDQATVFNPTNHSYFNLAGHSSGPVQNHQIQVLASQYAPIDERGIPTGEIAKVDATPFDLRPLTPIYAALDQAHQQLDFGNGLDHNLCLDYYQPQAKTATYAGKALSDGSNIELKIYTSMPGIQIFTANHFSDKIGKDGAIYQGRQGVCFETQYYPDSPNQPHFPSATLKADETFYSVTEYEVVF